MVDLKSQRERRARITFETDPDVKRRFKGFCSSSGMEMTEVLEQAVLEILAEYENGETDDFPTEGVQR